MSGGYFAANPARIASAAPEVERLASRVHAMNKELAATLAQLGDCWGNDEMGRNFAKQYVNARDQMVQGLNAASKVLTSTSQGISTMAKGFQRGEEAAIEAAAASRPEAPRL